MNYKIDPSASTPAYIQLYRLLADDITSAIYPYGSKLPSKRVIAAETGVSVITVEHAIMLLSEEGYVQSRQRSGVYVIYKDDDFFTNAGKRPAALESAVQNPGLAAPTRLENSTNLREQSMTIAQENTVQNPGLAAPARLENSINLCEQSMTTAQENAVQNPGLAAPARLENSTNLREQSITTAQENVVQAKGEFPFSVLAKTMRKVLLDYGEKILIKSPNHGCLQLREEICHYLARSRRIAVTPSQVIIGSGAEYLYGLIAQLLETGSCIAIEKPSYGKIREVYEAMGITCDQLPMDQNGIISDALEDTSAKILHITPFNSYPSGVTADISKKMEYLRWAKKRNGILIEDNYDSELTISRKMEEPLFSMDPDGKVIYLNTFSRTLAPSMRIGYMILPPRLVDRFQEKLGFYSCTVPIFDQYVLAELLKNGDFERHLNRLRRAKRKSAGL